MMMKNTLENIRTLIPANLRELPPLSLGVAVLWTAAFLVMQLGYADLLRDAGRAHHEAAQLANRHPTIKIDAEQMQVVRAVDHDFETDSLFSGFMERSRGEELATIQATFDETVGHAQSRLAEHPFRRLGHVPSATTPVSYASYFLLHSNFAHFIATLLMFLLVAPLLESTWGSKRLALAMLMLVPLGAVTHSLAFSESQRALTGGSSLIAGLVAAALVRFWGEEIEPLDWLNPVMSIDLRVPTIGLGVLWIGYEALLWVVVQSELPLGIDNDPGYASHAVTALVGCAAAICSAKFGLETPARGQSSPQNAAAKKSAARRFDLEKVRAMRTRGQTDAAFALLDSEVQQNASNRDIVMTYWEMAIERQTPLDAAPAMSRLLEEELRRGAYDAAVRIWRMLGEHTPDFLLHPNVLFALVPAIRAAEGDPSALEALRQIVDRRNQSFTAAYAAKVARLTAEMDPKTAALAAQRAIDSLDLDEKEQAELELLARALDPNELEIQPEKPLRASAFEEEIDRSAFGSSQDLSDLSESFPDGSLTHAIPMTMQTDALMIAVEGREPSALAVSRIRAVSIVLVRGLAEQPTALFDLLIDGRGSDRPLSVIRFNCDRFDPCAVVPHTKTRREALHTLLQNLLANGNARCLVDATTAKPGPDTHFDSLDAYHDQVLRPASGVLG